MLLLIWSNNISRSLIQEKPTDFTHFSVCSPHFQFLSESTNSRNDFDTLSSTAWKEEKYFRKYRSLSEFKRFSGFLGERVTVVELYIKFCEKQHHDKKSFDWKSLRMCASLMILCIRPVFKRETCPLDGESGHRTTYHLKIWVKFTRIRF